MALNKILLAVDDSADSRKAAELVLDLAQNQKVNVVILHVSSEVPAALGDSNDSEDAKKHFADIIGQKGKATVEFYQGVLCRLGIQSTVRIAAGDTAEEIVRCAQTEKCDLIVMGATGRGGLAEMFLGSVSHDVVKKSTLPVLLAR